MRAARLVFSVLAAGAFSAGAGAQDQAKPAAKVDAKVDVTGKWAFTVQTDQGTGTPTVTLKQEGDSLSGHYSSQLLGEQELKGTLKGGKLTFWFSGEVQGQKFTVTYTGTMDGADAMKGEVDLGGAASGSFTAKRQKP